MKTEPLKPHPVIRSFMGREVHCASRITSAVRQTVAGLWGSYAAFKSAHDRNHRRFAIAGIMLAHAENKTEYHNVMRGTCHPWKTVRNPFRFNRETSEVTIERKA